MELILPITGLSKSDVGQVGGKAANLGELMRARMPVPPGFVVTVSAYDQFLATAGLRGSLDALLAAPGEAMQAHSADRMRELIVGTPIPAGIHSAVHEAYVGMGQGPVAVRSSATAEDLAEASFAGQQETFLNVEGGPEVLRAVQSCWASLYGAHAVHYRATSGFSDAAVKIAVVVQQMVEAECAGVMFTLNPVMGTRDEILIEAVYGLGEACVSGAVTPDLYVVSKTTAAVLDSQVQRQDRQLVRRRQPSPDHERNEWVDVDPSLRARAKLSGDQIGTLVRLGVRLERHFGHPLDIEWVSRGDAFHIVQARPITTL